MKVTFDTLSENEVNEVVTLLENMGMVKVGRLETPVTPVEDKTPEKNSKPKPTPKKAVEPKSEPKQEAGIKLADLKESAKNAVTRSSREDVKKTIAEFAEKLAEVDETDYGKLYKKLQELGA